MRCDDKQCGSKKIKYLHSFALENVYYCKSCGKRVIVKAKHKL